MKLDLESDQAMEIDDVKDLNKTKNERLRGHKLPLTCVCIDSKDRFAYTGSKDGSIIKWCLLTNKISNKVDQATKKTGKDGIQKKHHTKHINCLAISSDDKFLASGGFDRHIRIWSPDTLTWLHSFSLHRQEITTLAFRKGHHVLYSGSADRSVMLWTLEDDDNRAFIEALYGHESSITSMDTVKKERILTSGGRDQSIRLWKLVEQAQTVFECKHESVDVVRFIDDKTFVSGGEDGSIKVWTNLKRTPLFIQDNAHKSDEEMKDSNHQKLSYWITSLATHSFAESTKKTSTKITKRRRLDVSGEEDAQYDEDKEDSDEEHDGQFEDDANDSDDEPGNEQQTKGKKSTIALVASGSCDSKIRLWRLEKAGSKHGLKLFQTIDCAGFVNDLKFTGDGTKLIAACGQEHRFGRWWKLKGSKNSIKIFEVSRL